MGFFRDATLHGFVVGMLARVVVYFKPCWLECCIDLRVISDLSDLGNFQFLLTLIRIESSTGVRDMVEISRLASLGRQPCIIVELIICKMRESVLKLGCPAS